MPHRYQHGASEELRQADGILKEKQESKKIILENRILCVQPRTSIFNSCLSKPDVFKMGSSKINEL